MINNRIMSQAHTLFGHRTFNQPKDTSENRQSIDYFRYLISYVSDKALKLDKI